MGTTTDLIGKAGRGDDGALAELASRHRPFLVRWARRHMGAALRQRISAEDIAQEAMFTFWNCFKNVGVNDGKELRRLLCRLVKNRLLDKADYFQASCRRIESDADHSANETVEQAVARGMTPQAFAASREEAALVRSALLLLPLPDRAVLMLRLPPSDLDFGEVGVSLAISAEAARKRFDRARARLSATLGFLKGSRVTEALEVSGETPGEPADTPH